MASFEKRMNGFLLRDGCARAACAPETRRWAAHMLPKAAFQPFRSFQRLPDIITCESRRKVARLISAAVVREICFESGSTDFWIEVGDEKEPTGAENAK